jgi:hypothetical protein
LSIKSYTEPNFCLISVRSNFNSCRFNYTDLIKLNFLTHDFNLNKISKTRSIYRELSIRE